MSSLSASAVVYTASFAAWIVSASHERNTEIGRSDPVPFMLLFTEHKSCRGYILFVDGYEKLKGRKKNAF